jgi:hypothetical protein
VPRGEPATGFLEQRLIVIHPHAAHAHQFSGDTRKAFVEDQFADKRALFPEILDLEQCLFAGVALLHRFGLRVALRRRARNLLAVKRQRCRRKNILELDEPVAAITSDWVSRQRERRVQFAENCFWGGGHIASVAAALQRRAVSGFKNIRVSPKRRYASPTARRTFAIVLSASARARTAPSCRTFST